MKTAIAALAGVLAFSAAAPAAAQMGHGDQWYGTVLLDQLEYRVQDGDDVLAWNGQAWYGGDYNRVWLNTEGEYLRGEELEQAEVQLLYSRLLGYFYDLQGGIRYDFRPDPSRFYGVIGLQGLAPGFFELNLQGFLSEEGDVSARLEGEVDLLITQRLILQPRIEIDLAAQDVDELGVGRGISTIEPGLRLRYEITRKFAPYIGVNWERALGETADLAREEGEEVSNVSLVAGVRFFF